MGRVLVIDDDADFAGMLVRYINRAGHETRAACALVPGLELAGRFLPDASTLIWGESGTGKELMRVVGGDIARACSISGLSRSRLYALLSEHGVEKPAPKGRSSSTLRRLTEPRPSLSPESELSRSS